MTGKSMRLLGVGQFEWCKYERSYQRWGAFILGEPHPHFWTNRLAPLNRPAFRELAGQRVRLVARPIERPRCTGRRALAQYKLAARGVARAAQIEGEVELGVGRLHIESLPPRGGEPAIDQIALQTGDRTQFWMSPRTFRQLRGLHVVVCAEVTKAALAPTLEQAAGNDDE
jgi:hypothetical protein